MTPPAELLPRYKMGGFTFRWNGDSYEARGREVRDDYGDPKPEPDLMQAGRDLREHFIDDLGLDADFDYGEKGWVYVGVYE